MSAAPAALPEVVRTPTGHAQLSRVWSDRPGFWGWLRSVDHRSIAKRYIVTAFVMFALGGIEAALIRAQLSRPENDFIGPDLYNQIFTVHGTTMMFLFAVPIMQAAGLYLVPLMVGTRNVAFPRLNQFGYYMYLIAALTLYVGLFTNTGPDTGWFSYVPLAGPEYASGKRVDVWSQVVTFTEISALVSAVEIIVTVFKQRAPGLTLNRLPLYVWALLVTSFMVVFAMPAVATASVMLSIDRLVGTHIFNPAEGGDALLWQHLFWFFGHPEVYIIFIPATGFVSAVVATFCRRQIFGYPAMVLALVATGVIGFGLWVHHMFATTVPQLGSAFFTAASISIAIPSGIQIFCWIATIWAGRPRFDTPLLFVCGFIFLFVLGGLTGVMIASVPFDLQVHDTFFIVAHFHYVLVGGAVTPLFAAFYYWFPKVTGRMLNERAGKVNFWLWFIGLNVTFFPMHQLGLEGMPRRVYTYLDQLGWAELNLTASIGALIVTSSVLVFLGNVVVSLKRGRPAGDDPWGGETLEWVTSSPPPPYNYAELPVVQGRAAAWSRTPDGPVVTGLSTEKREVLVTTLLDAEPDNRHEQPEPTIWPLFLAVSVCTGFLLGMFTPWGPVIGAALATIGFAGWAWPRGEPDSAHEVVELPS
ncbi:MAG TPA: cytochrome c oxidase subunit I [Gemmatimonadales bacterium]